MSEKIIFLDFDGVIRVPKSGLVCTPEHFDFCPERINRLAKTCSDLNAKVVVSSDWRNFDSEALIRNVLSNLEPLLHKDWATPVIGQRWQEVGFWLMKHDVEDYIILEDVEMHFEGAGEEMKSKIIWCESNKGLTDREFSLIYKKLDEPTT